MMNGVKMANKNLNGSVQALAKALGGIINEAVAPIRSDMCAVPAVAGI